MADIGSGHLAPGMTVKQQRLEGGKVVLDLALTPEVNGELRKLAMVMRLEALPCMRELKRLLQWDREAFAAFLTDFLAEAILAELYPAAPAAAEAGR